MATQEKIETVQGLNEKFGRAKAAVIADYQGISSPEMTQLRAHMRERSVEFLVIKNTLAKLAAKNTSFEVLDEDFKGPVSLVVSYEDAVAPAKALADYGKTDPEKEPEILCGMVEGKKITSAQVKALSNLPPKEVMIAQLLSVFQAPTSNFVGVFKAIMRQFVGTLEAVKDKKSNG